MMAEETPPAGGAPAPLDPARLRGMELIERRTVLVDLLAETLADLARGDRERLTRVIAAAQDQIQSGAEAQYLKRRHRRTCR